MQAAAGLLLCPHISCVNMSKLGKKVGELNNQALFDGSSSLGESDGQIYTRFGAVSYTHLSDNVGEPKGTRPNFIAFGTNGCFSSIREELRRNERCLLYTSVLLYIRLKGERMILK